MPALQLNDPGIMARLVRLQLLATEQLESVTVAHGIAFNDYLVLGVIRRSPHQRCTPSFVCESLHRTSGGMTLTLDRLQRAGLLERSRDHDDRRKVVLTLTRQGRELATRINAALHAWEASVVRNRLHEREVAAALDAVLATLEPPRP